MRVWGPIMHYTKTNILNDIKWRFKRNKSYEIFAAFEFCFVCYYSSQKCLNYFKRFALSYVRLYLRLVSCRMSTVNHLNYSTNGQINGELIYVFSSFKLLVTLKVVSDCELYLLNGLRLSVTGSRITFEFECFCLPIHLNFNGL